MPVSGGVSPMSVVVEIFVARHLTRDVAGGFGPILAAVAVHRPAVEAIVAREPINFVVEWLVILRVVTLGVVASCAAVKNGLLIGHDGVVVAATERFAAAVENLDGGGAALCVDIHAVFTDVLNLEREVRSVHLDHVVIVEMADIQNHGPLRQTQLGRAIIEIEKREAGLAADADGRRSHMQFAARVAVGPQIVAGGHGTVRHGLDPFAFAAGLERN